jgi:hypothetical protein
MHSAGLWERVSCIRFKEVQPQSAELQRCGTLGAPQIDTLLTTPSDGACLLQVPAGHHRDRRAT